MRYQKGVPGLTAGLDFARVRAALAVTLGSLATPDTPPGNTTQAAVAALFAPHTPLRLLLIRRAKNEHDPWSAHMAFPGGKRDPEDETLLATALRETREEIGIDLQLEGELLGRLPEQSLDRGAAGHLTVQPFVYALTGDPTLRTNHEVEKVVWLPVDDLETGVRDTTVLHEYRGSRLRFPAWDLDGDKVWGLTYRMIQSLLALLEEA